MIFILARVAGLNKHLSAGKRSLAQSTKTDGGKDFYFAPRLFSPPLLRPPLPLPTLFLFLYLLLPLSFPLFPPSLSLSLSLSLSVCLSVSLSTLSFQSVENKFGASTVHSRPRNAATCLAMHLYASRNFSNRAPRPPPPPHPHPRRNRGFVSSDRLRYEFPITIA